MAQIVHYSRSPGGFIPLGCDTSFTGFGNVMQCSTDESFESPETPSSLVYELEYAHHPNKVRCEYCGRNNDYDTELCKSCGAAL